MILGAVIKRTRLLQESIRYTAKLRTPAVAIPTTTHSLGLLSRVSAAFGRRGMHKQASDRERAL